jgi:hypothetical protein
VQRRHKPAVKPRVAPKPVSLPSQAVPKIVVAPIRSALPPLVRAASRGVTTAAALAVALLVLASGSLLVVVARREAT